MLTVQQFQKVKNDDATLFEGLQKVVDAFNKGFSLAGLDPMPAAQADAGSAIPAPPAPASIAVSAAAGMIFVVLTAGPGAKDSALYFVEHSPSSKFASSTTYQLGHSLHLLIPAPPGTSYWRAYARYQMSAKSNYTDYSP